MMNKFFYIISLALLTTSCIKDEPLGREADIVNFNFEGIVLVSNHITNDKIQLVVSSDENIRNLIPVIELSNGATVEPASGIAQDFSEKVKYMVTSEDGNWKKEYEVSVSPTIDYEFDFEDWVISGSGTWQYPALKDISWSSANIGIMLAKAGQVELYPTRDTTFSVEGEHAAVLQTQRGGTYWNQLIPIFSGSLFRGVFRLNQNDFVESAKFGQIHPKEKGKPVLFTGNYIYRPGKVFLDKNGNAVPGKVDEFSIYAILYHVDKGEAGKETYLNANDILTSSRIVARAVVEDHSAKEKFTHFSIPFTYEKQVDYNTYDYKLAVVFASSKDGAFYEGAPGSMLIVDESEIVCEDFE